MDLTALNKICMALTVFGGNLTAAVSEYLPPGHTHNSILKRYIVYN